MTPLTFLALAALGLLVGAYGTLIGAGGGFILVPVLLLLYPTESPATITSISLAVVGLNALSGTLAYARQRRVDVASGLRFALATIPGAVAGALVVQWLPRGLFDLILGLLLIGGGGLVLVTAHRPENGPDPADSPPQPGQTLRMITDRTGKTYRYAYSLPLGLISSLLVGFLSSVLGIGGGIIHVPVLVHLLHFPAHIATATSHFVLAIMALTATVVHLLTGEFHTGWRRASALALGVVVGAQIGARLAQRVHGTLILRLLALALMLVGLRLLLHGASGL